MNDGFLNAWRLYRRGSKRPAFAGEAPRGAADFDGDAAVGDIRIFADGNAPLVALVVEECGLSGRRIVPVSPFAAPASAREMCLGPRVFQLWNATKASRRFTDRSWRVATLTPEEVRKVRDALPAAHPGRLTAGEGPVARYEREFLVSAGNFIPFAEPVAEKVPVRWASGWGAVASVALLLGVACVFVGEDLRRGGAGGWNVDCRAAEESEDYETIELVEAETPESEGVEGMREEIARATRPENRIPALPEPVRLAEGRARMRTGWRGVRGALEGLSPRGTEAEVGEGFVRSAEVPRVTLVASVPLESSACRESKKAFSYAATPPVTASPGAVSCLLTECAWNESHRLLNVRAPVAAGLSVTIAFDAANVGAYRVVSEGEKPGEINAFYEIAPAKGLSALPEGAIRVTTRWCGEEGLSSREETVRRGDPSELPDSPRLPRRKPSAAGATAPDDVRVRVTL